MGANNYIQNPVDLFAKNPDGEATRLLCDQFGNLSIVPVEHYRIHNGQSYEAVYLWGDGKEISNNGSADFLIEVRSAMHVVFDISVEGDCEVYQYHNPSYTVASPQNLVSINNKNEYSSNTSDVIIYADPTISDVGTLKSAHFLPGGSGPHSAGGHDGGFSREAIWAARSPFNSKLIRVTNRSGAVAKMSIGIEWYQIN